MWKLVTFLLLSLPILYISRAALRARGSHGFYRFFAWEAILGLFLLNVEAWFRDPFSWHQVISWILLFASIIPLVLGVKGLRSRGKPVKMRDGDPTLLAFERTTALVTTGIYRFVRHPLYSSLLLLAWGIFFKDPSWSGILLSTIATLFLVLTARADETECIQFFGEQYLEYRKRTKMFFPFLF